ncbi:hypothetical protein D9758_006243 [Tetrapyrgos nigripes]|uniref:Galactose oxidase n=1 Tax=Tetrapyrgos nigripes TaxID=182062 RepID=A0A8H5GAS8_9AGAR|nr:hypothetical protein D9758_006243 [Tetrapyrgos nigripes]
MSVITTPSILGASDDEREDSFPEMASTPAMRTPLTDVPEHGPFTPTTPDYPNSPYFTSTAARSSATLGGPTYAHSSSSGGGGSQSNLGTTSRRSGSSRKPSRNSEPDNRDSSSSSSGARRTTPSASSNSSHSTMKDEHGHRERKDRDREGHPTKSPSVRHMGSGNLAPSSPRIRTTPRLPHDKDAEPAPSTIMYWSRAPVFGTCPARTMRGHTVTLVDTTAWVFGGCDDKETSRDIYCFDVETMQWTHPETVGDIPPPSRAHTATLVDRKIYIFGGGQSSSYSDAVYILDTTTRRWTRPDIQGEIPAPRRAHTAVYYGGKIWVFGGGNGMMALNDVWALNVAKMEWERVRPRGMLDRHGRENFPTPRGYHTANLVGNMMIVVGGSDGKDCFAEVWLLNLDSLEWTIIELPESYKRLSHTSTQVGSYLFIQGGHNGAEYVNDMKFFNLVNLQYEHRQVLGKFPTPRGYHVSILADSRLFFFGGYNGASAYDDVHIVDLAGAAYLPQVTSFTIEV